MSVVRLDGIDLTDLDRFALDGARELDRVDASSSVWTRSNKHAGIRRLPVKLSA